MYLPRLPFVILLESMLTVPQLYTFGTHYQLIGERMEDTTSEITTKDTISDQLQTLQEPGEADTKSYFDRHFEGIILLGLALVALIPRIILATQLDMVTDEGTYIIGGKVYLPLVIHFRITSQRWNYNYEHPAFAKLLIGLAISLNTHLGNVFGELLVARMPSILCGTLLVLAIYWLGRAPFGRAVALLAALCLAVSPWLVYFSALAYLDMTMTALITIAYLLLWPAIRQPRLYLLSAALLGLGVASKYTAALAVPGMILFTAYYFFAIRPRLPAEQRPAIPWRWWMGALLVSPVIFLIADPAIWSDPLNLLLRSFSFEWNHSANGHLTFIAGQYRLHVPQWAVLYIVFAKMSVFVTIPAACFALFALVQLIRFHLLKSRLDTGEVTSIAFLFIWLCSILGMFSLLNIVVGTHYLLPIAAPVASAGAFAWLTLLRYRRGALFRSTTTSTSSTLATQPAGPTVTGRPLITISRRAAVVLALLTVFMVGSHLVGLTTVYAAEGYTSEAFNGENTVLQVAYPGYREAATWLVAHTHSIGRVGLVAIIGTLNPGYFGVSWYTYNPKFTKLNFIEVHPDAPSFPYDYLVWPMHLVQRGYTIPEPWRSHIVHVIMGGKTTYCFIMAHDPATIS
jgi:4-amino-4-deoxy-L-arabinose transferase-like glycosyltransferase